MSDTVVLIHRTGRPRPRAAAPCGQRMPCSAVRAGGRCFYSMLLHAASAWRSSREPGSREPLCGDPLCGAGRDDWGATAPPASDLAAVVRATCCRCSAVDSEPTTSTLHACAFHVVCVSSDNGSVLERMATPWGRAQRDDHADPESQHRPALDMDGFERSEVDGCTLFADHVWSQTTAF